MFDNFFFFPFLFCKSKDFKAFLRCSCVHFFQFLFFGFFIFFLFCNNSYYYLYFIEDGGCFPKVSMLFEVQ